MIKTKASQAMDQNNVSFPYKLIFMDLSMPIMDGYEASRQIRAFEEENLPEKMCIIALTAN